jgi:hypothetical protein
MLLRLVGEPKRRDDPEYLPTPVFKRTKLNDGQYLLHGYYHNNSLPGGIHLKCSKGYQVKAVG